MHAAADLLVYPFGQGFGGWQ